MGEPYDGMKGEATTPVQMADVVDAITGAR